jgi:16S rRNA (adenine1518-N6/adenine1519-N6)-dimethyltransferase
LTFAALPPLREIIARYGLGAKKALGQHFLLDLNLTRRIVDAAGDLAGCTAFEVGPGPGGLTRALLDSNAAQIVAVEKDRRCIEALGELAAVADGRLQIVEGDALALDLTALAPGPRALIANLPYNIATPLLIGWLKQIEEWRSLTLMFQAEVVDRLAAAPGTPAYGRLSVIAQFCCHVKRVLALPARAFTPPPKVDSAVVHLTPRQDRPPDVAFEVIEKLTAAAFGQRRKMLRASLRPLGGEALLRRAGINPELRAETLSVRDFENLARRLEG